VYGQSPEQDGEAKARERQIIKDPASHEQHGTSENRDQGKHMRDHGSVPVDDESATNAKQDCLWQFHLSSPLSKTHKKKIAPTKEGYSLGSVEDHHQGRGIFS
jgi:hypothetical protein